MSIPAESITNCDTNTFFNRANLYFTITYTYIMITICKNLLFVPEIYISLVLETFNDILFELHQDKTFCKSVVKVSTNVSIEWLDLPNLVSSANMSAQVLVSERGRLFT